MSGVRRESDADAAAELMAQMAPQPGPPVTLTGAQADKLHESLQRMVRICQRVEQSKAPRYQRDEAADVRREITTEWARLSPAARSVRAAE